MMSDNLPAADNWFLTGPTASGKTSVALALARLLDAEIISLDSMALYRGLDIGTAKPLGEERRQAKYHLIDLIGPEEEFSLAQYVAAAHTAVTEVRSRGRAALFVGGTPLYLKALLRGIFVGPPADWQFRRRLEAEAHQRGDAWLHEQVAAVDPTAAWRLHPRDTRRLIRALEVHAQTGRPISELQSQFEHARPAEDCRVFVLDWPRDELYRRIETRVDAMFAAGLVEEVRQLLAAGQTLGRTARQALGYREALEYLAGERVLEETVALVKTRTRQFARRQLTWFRALSECRWIGVSEPFDPAAIAARIVADAIPR
jgi:tRNA dimethylallyltransferase